MSDEFNIAERTALRVAFRHFNDDTTTEEERDAILRAMTLRLPSPEAEAASRMLYHREHGRSEQMLIASLLAQPAQEDGKR